jgi:hypothetical protein
MRLWTWLSRESPSLRNVFARKDLALPSTGKKNVVPKSAINCCEIFPLPGRWRFWQRIESTSMFFVSQCSRKRRLLTGALKEGVIHIIYSSQEIPFFIAWDTKRFISSVCTSCFMSSYRPIFGTSHVKRSPSVCVTQMSKSKIQYPRLLGTISSYVY